jgi:hypothetical protein
MRRRLPKPVTVVRSSTSTHQAPARRRGVRWSASACAIGVLLAVGGCGGGDDSGGDEDVFACLADAGVDVSSDPSFIQVEGADARGVGGDEVSAPAVVAVFDSAEEASNMAADDLFQAQGGESRASGNVFVGYTRAASQELRTAIDECVPPSP